MAVFLINICKFNGCGIVFPTLRELIQHIEDTHIDFDPQALERQELQQPSCLPTSCILRVFTDGNRKSGPEIGKKRPRAHSPASSICSSTPNGSEMDEEEVLSGSEDSNDSWASKGEFKSEFLLRLMGASGKTEDSFNFRTPASKKRAKTPSVVNRSSNGSSSSNKSGAKKDNKDKTFICPCGRSYKTSKGLKNHSITHHGSTPLKPHINYTASSDKSDSVASTVLSSFLKAQKMQNYITNMAAEKQQHQQGEAASDQQNLPLPPDNNAEGEAASPSSNNIVKMEHSALLEELKAPTGLSLQSPKTHNPTSQSIPSISGESLTSNSSGTSILSSPKSLPLSSPTLHQHLLSPLTKVKTSQVQGGSLSSILDGESFSAASEDQKSI